jgi:hypothetical protein
MILSRDTYAYNKHMVDELSDTSLHRGGAPVRPRSGYYEDGGVGSGALPTTTGPAAGQELMRAVNRVEDAVRSLPSWQYIGWDQDDTAELEQRLDERGSDRANDSIR